MPVRLADLNAMSRDDFVAALGRVFEHSPWIAEGAWAARPFAGVAALHAAMLRTVAAAGPERQLALIRAHPDLAGKAARAGALTRESASEQGGLGLDRLSDAEYERFDRLNRAYRDRFGMPFIVAVRNHTKDGIFASYEARLGNDAETERARALAEIGEIARFRLQDLVAE